MSARNSKKWLTPHALRSGLREQAGSSGVIVELGWSKSTDDYSIIRRDSLNATLVHTTHDLAQAREVFTAQHRKVLRPSLEGKNQ